MGARVCVIKTGSANLASVVAALRRLGAEPEVTTEPGVVRAADRVVLPGVGAFGAAMGQLEGLGMGEPIRAHVCEEKPFLAICLGLQLLCDESEESPGVRGLSVIEGKIKRFAEGLIVPQLGWNLVEPGDGCALLQAGHAYYANSYRLEALPEGWRGATSVHGASFVAAIEKGPMLACQFHPELSGRWGRELLERWLAAPGARGGGSC